MKRFRSLGGVAAIVAMMLSGCTHLEVDRVSQMDGQLGDTRIGARPQTDRIDYNLPRTSIVIQATITLNDCDNIIAVQSADPKDDLLEDSPPMDVTEDITANLTSDPDPSQQYSIRIDKTRSWAKQLNLAVARNPNHTLVSYNGTLTDQAGPTIVAAIGTAVAIGGAVAMPATIPVSAGLSATALRDKVAATPISLKSKTALNIALAPWELKGLVPDGVALELADKAEGKDKKTVRATIADAIQERKKDEAAAKAKAATPKRPPLTTFCTSEVRQALGDIAQLQLAVNKSLKGAAKSKDGSMPAAGGSGDGSGASSAKPDASAVRAQAQIARIIKEQGLSRTIVWVWTPTEASLGNIYTTGEPIVTEFDEDLFTDAVKPWFSDNAVKTMIANRAKNATFDRLLSHVVARLTIQPWTIGHDFIPAEHPVDAASGDIHPDGVIYRDPALGRLRLCLGPCVDPDAKAASLVVKDAAGHPKVQAAAVKAIVYSDQTRDLGTQDVPLPQLGRINALSMRSKLFETSIANLALDANGSVTTVGTQGSNSAAAGLGGLTSAANAASSAVTARNSAITAGNTSLVSQAQIQDQRNTALADCLQKAQAIAAAGGKPFQCQ